ncbi:MAG: hypothetical protein JOZ18_20530 [Chloroflexi bacterium]|nr:hypothetical protein [Chloroflexota bacterium]
MPLIEPFQKKYGPESYAYPLDEAMLRVSDCLRAVAPGLSDGVVPNDSFERLLEISDLLPYTTGGIIECHLSHPKNVDLAVRVMAKPLERDALAGTHPTLIYPCQLFASPIWSRIRTFAQQWQEDGTPVNHRVYNVWLEFDTHLPHAVVTPCVFFDTGWMQSVSEPSGPAQEVDWIVETANLLAGQDFGKQTAANLERCVRLLPDAATLRYVGIMSSRPQAGIRLAISGLTFTNLSAYLAAIGWLDWTPALAETIALPDLPGARFMLDVDVGSRLGSVLGLEVSFAEGPHHTYHWHQLLEACINKGIITPSLLPALLIWPGLSTAKTTSGQWPPRLAHVTRHIVRRLNHLKLIYRSEEPVRAKAYLYFGGLNDSALVRKERGVIP